MAITSLGGVGNTTAQTGVSGTSDKLQSALESIVGGNNQSSDVTDLSVSSQLQSQTAALKTISGNLVQGLSLAQLATTGLGQIAQVIGQLQSLASQGQSTTLNTNNRRQLNQQFQQLSGDINNIVDTTSFNGQGLLNGGLTGDSVLSLDTLLGQPTSGNDATLSIPDASTGALFNGQDLNLSSPDSSNQALSTLAGALDQVVGAEANVNSFQQTLSYASANIDSALTNYQAAGATLDNNNAANQSSLAQVQSNINLAVAAQTSSLNPALLQLIS
jgi:flagellin